MKLKPSTLLLILTALLLGGIVLIVQTQVPPPPADQAEATEENLFSFQEKQVKTLALTTPLRSLKFERDKNGKWQMLEPEKTTANDSSIAFLLDLLATGKSQRSFQAPASEREQYSLHQPLATIEVTLDNQETHKLVVGGYDFNRSNLYALADPAANPKADLKVLLVSSQFENAVSRPLAEWKQAEEPKPSGSSSPSSSSSPSPEAPATPSPEASASPSIEASPAAPQTEVSPADESSPSPQSSSEASPEASPEATASP